MKKQIALVSVILVLSILFIGCGSNNDLVSITNNESTNVGPLRVAPVSGLSWTELNVSNVFPARGYHSSVLFDDKIWIIGGWEWTGSNFCDSYSSNDGSTWNVKGSNIFSGQGTHTHSSLVFNDGSGEKIYVIGGYTPYTYLNNIYSSGDGINFTNIGPVTGNEMPATGYHSSVIYDGKMWVIAGHTANGIVNEIFSSTDGTKWLLEEANPGFAPRWGQTVTKFNGEFYMIGGNTGSGRTNEIYKSTDLINWSLVTINVVEPIGGSIIPRMGHTSVVYDNKLWIIGGIASTYYLNDMWYTEDGTNWYRYMETDSNATDRFSPRGFHTSVVKDDKIFVIGGRLSSNTPPVANDVWTFSSYTPAPESVSFSNVNNYSASISWGAVDGAQSYNIYQGANATAYATTTSTSYDLTGLTRDTDYSFKVSAVSSSLGESNKSEIAFKTTNTTSIGGLVKKSGSPVTNARVQLGTATLPAGGTYITTNGTGKYRWDGITSGDQNLLIEHDDYECVVKTINVSEYQQKLYEDLIFLNTKVGFTIFSNPSYYSNIALTNHCIFNWGVNTYVVGGNNGATYKDNLLIYDNTNNDWDVVESNIVYKRYGASVVEFNGNMYIIGGKETDSNFKSNILILTKNGTVINWNESTTNIIFKRYQHASFVIDNEIYIYGGYDENGNLLNDCYKSSDGITWSPVTLSTNLTARAYHQVVTFKNALYMIGGYVGSGVYTSDVFKSTDGANWTKVETFFANPRKFNITGRVTAFVKKSSGVDDALYVVGKTSNSKYWYSKDGKYWNDTTSTQAISSTFNDIKAVFNESHSKFIFTGSNISASFETCSSN